MSANRERNFGRPSLSNVFSGRERLKYKVIDRQTGETVAEDHHYGAYVEIVGESIITHPENPDSGSGRSGSAHSLRNVKVVGDIRTPKK